MGRRAEGRSTHGTARHGRDLLTHERSRACDRRQRPQRARWTRRRCASAKCSWSSARSARARPARRPSERKDQRAGRAALPAAPAAPLDLAPLRTRIDDLVEESQRLSPLPATFESLRKRVDALDKGVNALRTEVAAVPKQLDASLNALKDAMVSRSAPNRSARPTSPGTSAPICFVEGNTQRRARSFSISSRTTRMMRGCGISPRSRTG